MTLKEFEPRTFCSNTMLDHQSTHKFKQMVVVNLIISILQQGLKTVGEIDDKNKSDSNITLHLFTKSK